MNLPKLTPTKLIIIILVSIAILLLLIIPKKPSPPPSTKNTPPDINVPSVNRGGETKEITWQIRYLPKNNTITEYRVTQALVNPNTLDRVLSATNLSSNDIIINDPSQKLYSQAERSISYGTEPNTYLYYTDLTPPQEDNTRLNQEELISIVNNTLNQVLPPETSFTETDVESSSVVIINRETGETSNLETINVGYNQYLEGHRVINKDSLSDLIISVDIYGVVRGITFNGGFITSSSSTSHRPYTQAEINDYFPLYSIEILSADTTSELNKRSSLSNLRFTVTSEELGYYLDSGTLTLYPVHLLTGYDQNKELRHFVLPINNPPN